MKTKSKMTFLVATLILIQAPFAAAGNVIINNNPAPQQSNEAPPPPPPPAQQTCGNANQNNIYDPRVPPAGVYHTSDANVYTTGEKKPYIVDNNCNNNSSQPMPQVYVQPNMPMR